MVRSLLWTKSLLDVEINGFHEVTDHNFRLALFSGAKQNTFSVIAGHYTGFNGSINQQCDEYLKLDQHR